MLCLFNIFTLYKTQFYLNERDKGISKEHATLTRSEKPLLIQSTYKDTELSTFCPRITEYVELEGNHKDYKGQLLFLHMSAQESHHVPDGVVQRLLNSVQLSAVTTYLGSPFQCSTTLWFFKPFPDTQPRPPLTQLHTIFSSPATGHKSEKISTCPFTSPCVHVEGHNEVSPQSPLLQAEQTK